jgi:hypothetical protein
MTSSVTLMQGRVALKKLDRTPGALVRGTHFRVMIIRVCWQKKSAPQQYFAQTEMVGPGG